MPAASLDDLVSLCKRRGFIFQSAEIYGGMKGLYDYGPLGVELKNAIKQSWWRRMVYERDDVEGLDAATLAHRALFKYSGHEATFTDPLVECKNCKARLRADKMKDPKKCDECGSADLLPPRLFNMLFPVKMGPVVEGEHNAYLRGETAQHIFANFKNVVDSTSRKLPFGIAQIGKAYRNEIVARNFIFRVREFEQMELEFFVMPGEDEKWHDYWLEERLAWWESIGVPRTKIRVNDVAKADLSHYSKRTFDLEYHYPHGVEEVEGIANRTDFDLGNHSKDQGSLNLTAKYNENHESTAKLAVQTGEGADAKWVVPYVVEPSCGVDRALLAVLCEAYTVENVKDGERIVLKLLPHLAPIKAAVIPLARNKPELVAKAKEIKDSLQKLGLGRILLENTGNIGKAYRRHDEIGTPLCITVDFETIEEGANRGTVTIRNRDTMEQTRLPIAELKAYVNAAITA